MPINKRSYERHLLIDKFLQNKLRWESTTSLFEALEEQMHHDSLPKISLRTFQRDLKDLRELYLAPLNWNTKGYEDDDPTYIGYTSDFSIRNVSVEEQDVQTLRDAGEILKGIADIKGLLNVEEAIGRITDKRNQHSKKRSRIYFESHTQVDNLDYLPTLISAVNQEYALDISYKPYNEAVRKYLFHPYVLREYRNRWFLIGAAEGNKRPLTLAIDRIQDVKKASVDFEPNEIFDPETYFENLIGVSPSYDADPETITIKVYPKSADYILTKPIHHNQRLLDDAADDGSVIVELTLHINYELKQTLLSYGDGLEVLKPSQLRSEMKTLFSNLVEFYSKS